MFQQNVVPHNHQDLLVSKVSLDLYGHCHDIVASNGAEQGIRTGSVDYPFSSFFEDVFSNLSRFSQFSMLRRHCPSALTVLLSDRHVGQD